jgi:hypothetical protein
LIQTEYLRKGPPHAKADIGPDANVCYASIDTLQRRIYYRNPKFSLPLGRSCPLSRF